MNKKNTTTLSVRIDDDLNQKLEKLAEQIGQNKSQIVKDLLNSSDSVKFVDGSKIAEELFRIRQLLQSETFPPQTEQEVKQACDLHKRRIKEAFEKGCENNGNIESNKLQ